VSAQRKGRRQAITAIFAPLELCKGFSFYPSRWFFFTTSLNRIRDASENPFCCLFAKRLKRKARPQATPKSSAKKLNKNKFCCIKNSIYICRLISQSLLWIKKKKY